MKAVILAGGEGTRLRPLTCNVPKPMVPVLNRPFLAHMIDYLKKHSIDDIILALCYRPDRIQSHFGDGTSFGVRLTYVVEDSPLGTAGAVKNVEEYLEGPFFVFNGDIFTDLDLTAMMSYHRESGAKVSIALTAVEDPTLYGLVETDADGRVRRFVEKPAWDEVTTNMINAGTYLLDPDVLKYVPRQGVFTFERGLFPLLLEIDKPIYGYTSGSYWIDIGTPEKYLKLHHDLLRKMATDGEIFTADGLSIHSTADIKGPVAVGRNCEVGSKAQIIGPAAIGEGCRIGSNTIIQGAILWDEVSIGRGATLRNCVVAGNACVGRGCWIEDGVVVGENVIIGDGSRLEHGTRVWPGERLGMKR